MLGFGRLEQLRAFEQPSQRPYSRVVERNQSAPGISLCTVSSNSQTSVNQVHISKLKALQFTPAHGCIRCHDSRIECRRKIQALLSALEQLGFLLWRQRPSWAFAVFPE